MDQREFKLQERSTPRGSAISAESQGPSGSLKDSSDDPPPPQGNQLPVETSDLVPDIMEMRHPDLVVVETRSASGPPAGPHNPIRNFWNRQVSLTVPHEACRDHLALERTYLSYLRTALTFAQLGVIVAQLFRLQHNISPNPHLGFFVLGPPLASVCYGTAILLALSGAARFWKQQNAMARGRIWAGGWEPLVLFIILILILVTVLVLITVIDISRQ